jgi:protein involved in temperature-dependent protein secretion
MTEISESETLRSHITHLIEEQKYDEALAILSDLRETSPSDRELRMYYLLVVRILVLRWNLSRTATGAAIDSYTIAKRIIRSLASVVRVPDTTKLIQSLNQIYQLAEAALAKRRIRRVITAGAGTALLALYMVEGSNVAILVSSNILPPTYASHSKVSALGAKALPTEADERNFFQVNSESSHLLPTEHLQDSTDQKLALTGTDATPQVDASKFFAKHRQPRAVLKIESSRKLAANENNRGKTPREILGHYQSRWAIPIRKSTSFGAAIVQEIDSGISLSVLEFVGSWAKVEFGPEGMTGFVRREFLTSVKKNESNVTDNSPSGEEISDVTIFSIESTS